MVEQLERIFTLLESEEGEVPVQVKTVLEAAEKLLEDAQNTQFLNQLIENWYE